MGENSITTIQSGRLMALKRRGEGEYVRAGDMRTEVTIQQLTQASDGQGGRTGTSADIKTTWANLMPLSASRALAYGIPMTNRPYDIDTAMGGGGLHPG